MTATELKNSPYLDRVCRSEAEAAVERENREAARCFSCDGVRYIWRVALLDFGKSEALPCPVCNKESGGE